MFALLLALVTALSWSEGRPLPRGVDHHATFIMSGGWSAQLHVLGGNDYREQFATHWVADINRDGSLGEWREAEPLPLPTLGHTVIVEYGHAYAIAGQHAGRQNSADVYIASQAGRDAPELGPWSRGPSLPAPRFHAAIVEREPFIYVLGGLETTNSSATVFRTRIRPDGSLTPWETLDSLPRPRSHQAAVVYRDAIYMIGGLDGNPAGRQAPLWDVVRAPILRDGRLGRWETVGSLDSAYATHGAFVHDRMLYVVGGVENNLRFTDMVQRAALRPDGSLGAWERLSALPKPRGHVHHLPVINGRVYSVGGSQGRTVIPDVVVGVLR